MSKISGNSCTTNRLKDDIQSISYNCWVRGRKIIFFHPFTSSLPLHSPQSNNLYQHPMNILISVASSK